MYLAHEVEQEGFPCAIIEPNDTEHIVATTAVLPVIFQELLLGVIQFPAAVSSHDREHALITRMLVVVLQNLQGKHIGPQFPAPVLVRIDRSEVSIGLCALENGLYPEVSLIQHLPISQLASQGMIASQPVGNLLPSMRATLFQPCITFLVEPVAYLAKPSCQAFRLAMKDFSQPATRLYTAQRQFEENIGGQWGTIIDVEGTRRLHILRIDHGRLLGQCLYWNQHDHQVYEK